MIKTLFLDIGGVLLTNGWDYDLRKKIAQMYQIDFEKMSKRHELVFDLFERGKMSFDDYLKWTIFNEKRNISLLELKNYIFDSARPFQDMIDLTKDLKKAYKLKVVALSNEGKELALDRIKRFNLESFIDIFVISSYVHCRKPDHEIYHIAMDMSHSKEKEICYIDDRDLLIESAQALEIPCIHHKTFTLTQEALRGILTSVNVTPV